MSDGDRRKNLAAALGRVPSGLFIVTARNGSLETGMLASWVQQCSFEPPQITLALKRGRYVGDWLTPGATFIINVLEANQTEIIAHFGKGFTPGQPAFEGLEIDRPGGVPPVLTEALAYLECRVSGRYPAGDHELFVAEVVSGGVLSEGQPMVHVRKSGLHY